MFEWITAPTVFEEGLADYEIATFHELFAFCEDYATRIQFALRRDAPWQDQCMPGREYIRAEAFYPDTQSVGIRIWYDLDLYRSQCGEPPFDWGARHETVTFSVAGVISVILPQGELSGRDTALGAWADELWDSVRALYGR